MSAKFNVITFSEMGFEDHEGFEDEAVADAYHRGISVGSSPFGGGLCHFLLPKDMEDYREFLGGPRHRDDLKYMREHHLDLVLLACLANGPLVGDSKCPECFTNPCSCLP